MSLGPVVVLCRHQHLDSKNFTMMLVYPLMFIKLAVVGIGGKLGHTLLVLQKLWEIFLQPKDGRMYLCKRKLTKVISMPLKTMYTPL